VEVHGSLDLKGNDLIGAVFGLEDNFPTDPRPGRFMMKGKVLYLCIEIADGVPVWVPLTRQITMLKFTQESAALEWTISHNLNVSIALVQVFDADGNVVIPNNINCTTLNQVTITFGLPTAGFAIIQRGEVDGATPPLYAFETSFSNSDTWVINHNLGYNPTIQCYIGQDMVQPVSIVHNSLNQSTVTFSTAKTGSVRCI
jgi:hypothetical protein